MTCCLSPTSTTNVCWCLEYSRCILRTTVMKSSCFLFCVSLGFHRNNVQSQFPAEGLLLFKKNVIPKLLIKNSYSRTGYGGWYVPILLSSKVLGTQQPLFVKLN